MTIWGRDDDFFFLFFLLSPVSPVINRSFALVILIFFSLTFVFFVVVFFVVGAVAVGAGTDADEVAA